MAYNKDLDYSDLIQQAAAQGDFATAAQLEASRNEKIAGENLPYQTTSDYASYLKSGNTGASLGNGVDYSDMLSSMMRNGASANDVNSILGTRINKALTTPGLSQYAYDNTYKQAKDYINANKRSDSYDALLDSLLSPDKYSYDYASDPVYQAYATQYTNKGKKSMQDTMGEYAAQTGGIPSTSAVSAAQGAQNEYMSELSGIIPTLESQAYDRYNTDQTNKLNLLTKMGSENSADQSDALSMLEQGIYNDSTLAALGLTKDQADAYIASMAATGAGTGAGTKTGTKTGTEESAPENLYQAMFDSGTPSLYLSQNYKEYGLTSGQLDSVLKEYQDMVSSGKFDKSSAAQDTSVPTGNVLYVAGYGYVSYDDAEYLEQQGFIKMTGTDANGDPVYAPTTKKRTGSMSLSR